MDGGRFGRDVEFLRGQGELALTCFARKARANAP
jgi:hypothetical protein